MTALRSTSMNPMYVAFDRSLTTHFWSTHKFFGIFSWYPYPGYFTGGYPVCRSVPNKLSSMLVLWQRNQLIPIRCPNCATLYVLFASILKWSVFNILQICIAHHFTGIRGYWKRSSILSMWQRQSTLFFWHTISEISWMATLGGWFLRWSSRSAEE